MTLIRDVQFFAGVFLLALGLIFARVGNYEEAAVGIVTGVGFMWDGIREH